MPKDHPFWDTTDRPIAIAHRGGAGALGAEKHKQENTIKTFKNVWDMGYRYIELDVISTSDKKVIVIHVAKNRWDRLAHQKDKPNAKLLQTMTHQQLKDRLERDIPTLEEVLTTFPKAKFLIDAKTDAVVQLLAKTIIATKAIDRVCMGSFYPHRVAKLRHLLGERACLQFIVSRTPLHFFMQKRYLKNKQWLKQVAPSVVAWPYIILNKPVLRYLHKLDLKVIAWTVNNPKNMQKMAHCGVDGIISDNAQDLQQVLKAQK
jgi:glycerophosphoryl diester phosphodiesterase